jgi:hypothetical protein
VAAGEGFFQRDGVLSDSGKSPALGGTEIERRASYSKFQEDLESM